MRLLAIEALEAAVGGRGVEPKPRPRAWLRHSRLDLLLVCLAGLHGVVLLGRPGAAVIAIGVWWGSNTIAHDFLHKPFFASRRLNRLFALYLTALLGIPQTLWRSRHLAHHAGSAWRLELGRGLAAELLVVVGVWIAFELAAPGYLLGSYLPGLALGLGLCALHGHGEHVRGTASYRGRIYNLLFLNDGYHAEHHEIPGAHWSRLSRLLPAGRASRWPPVLRWLEAFSLVGLERAAMRFHPARRFLLSSHERAFRRILARLPEPRIVGIVGGGLFPRTAIVLEKLLPRSRLVIIDQDAAHLDIARRLVGERVELVHATFDASKRAPYDLVILPLSFRGDRGAAYRNPPAPAVLVHDWIWRRRGRGAVISVLLLKRLNLCTSSLIPPDGLQMSKMAAASVAEHQDQEGKAKREGECTTETRSIRRVPTCLPRRGRNRERTREREGERVKESTSPGRSRRGPDRWSDRPSSR